MMITRRMLDGELAHQDDDAAAADDDDDDDLDYDDHTLGRRMLDGGLAGSCLFHVWLFSVY